MASRYIQRENKINVQKARYIINTVLILNHQHVKCGVYQFGLRVYNLVADSTKVNYIYKAISNREEYLKYVSKIKPNYIIYNYHWDRMPWLRIEDITGNKNAKHYFIYHDGSIFSVYDKYLMFGNYAPFGENVPEDKKIILPRPLFKYQGEYKKNEFPTIGSFGFAFNIKRFPELVVLVNNTFAHEKAILNIHLTQAYFGDIPGHEIKRIVERCIQNNDSKRITLNITTHFISNEELLTLLAGNDINVLNYAPVVQFGLSAATDYLLSVKRPIALADNSLFRHIISKEISLEYNNIKTIMQNGIKPLQCLYDKWSTDKFESEMEKLFI